MEIRIVIDDRIVRSMRWLLGRSPLRRVSWLCVGMLALGATVVLAAPEKPHDFATGDPIRAAQVNANFDALYDALEARVIRADLTLEVDDCAGLKAALVSLDGRSIASSARVTIALGEGTFDCDGPIVVDHADGGHIDIVGRGSSKGTGRGAAKTTLRFTRSDGLIVPPGRAVGSINGMDLQGSRADRNAPDDPVSGACGLLVNRNATARIGPDVVVWRFDVGVKAWGAQILADGVVVSQNGAGFVAYLNGAIRSDGALAEKSGYGFFAFIGGAISNTDSWSLHNQEDGLRADAESVVYGWRAHAQGNGVGHRLISNSSIIQNESTVSESSITDVDVRPDSFYYLSPPTTP